MPERYFTPPCPDRGAEADVVEPLTCIAWRQLRQRSDAVNSIWEVERFLHMLHALLDYADFPTALAPAQDNGPPGCQMSSGGFSQPWAAVSASQSGRHIRSISSSRVATSLQGIGKGAA